MFKERTVFVLGAGASCPYGFPTASGLKRLILGEGHQTAFPAGGIDFTWTGRNNGGGRMMLEMSLKAFRDRFEASPLFSIDAFVQSHPNDEFIARLFIANIILKIEQESPPRGGWMAVLVNEIIQNREAIKEGSITFVTFNYDRVLEQFLQSGIKASLPAGEADSLIAKLPVVHVYGSIGDLAVTEYGLQHRWFGDCKEIELMRVGATAKPEVSRPIMEADRLIFLGFGFDKLNMDTLAFNTTLSGKPVFASAFGLSASRRQAFLLRCPNASLGNSAWDIDAFIHETPLFV